MYSGVGALQHVRGADVDAAHAAATAAAAVRHDGRGLQRVPVYRLRVVVVVVRVRVRSGRTTAGRVDGTRVLGIAPEDVRQNARTRVPRVHQAARAVLRVGRAAAVRLQRVALSPAVRPGRRHAVRVRRDQLRGRRPTVRADVLLLAEDRQLRALRPFRRPGVRAALLPDLPVGVLRHAHRVPPARRHGRTPVATAVRPRQDDVLRRRRGHRRRRRLRP